MRGIHRVLLLIGGLPLLVACAGETLTGGLSRAVLPVQLTDAATGTLVADDDPRLETLAADVAARLPPELSADLPSLAAGAERGAGLPPGAIALTWRARSDPDSPPPPRDRTVYYELIAGGTGSEALFSGTAHVQLQDLRAGATAVDAAAPLLIDVWLDFACREGTYRLAPGLAEAVAEQARAIVADCASALGLSADDTAAADLTPRDVALLAEALHLQATLGAGVWPGWEPARVPVLYLSGGLAWLLDHPAPPEDYTRARSAALGRSVHVRLREPDEGELRASYPIAGHSTVVIAAPADDAEAWRWTLVFAHEMFHCFQGDGARHIDPFTDEYAGLHELDYPFPYDDESVRAALRIEAEFVHGLATEAGDEAATIPMPVDAAARSAAPGGSAADLALVPLLERCAVVQSAVLGDERHLQFKRWEEWKEGVAKYVERELSRAAAEPGRYAPLPEFAERFPGEGYAAAWDEHHRDQLHPVRFVGAGVRGRVMFYYLGLGKAVALDRLSPDWKLRYRASSLDELLQEAVGP